MIANFYGPTDAPVVYRVYDESGRLIYIGASRDVGSRFILHEQKSWWFSLIREVYTESYPTMKAAFAAEAIAIQEEQPAFNIQGTTDGPVLTPDDAELAWQWSSEPGRFLNSLGLILRVNECRRNARMTAEASAA